MLEKKQSVNTNTFSGVLVSLFKNLFNESYVHIVVCIGDLIECN